MSVALQFGDRHVINLLGGFTATIWLIWSGRGSDFHQYIDVQAQNLKSKNSILKGLLRRCN